MTVNSKPDIVINNDYKTEKQKIFLSCAKLGILLLAYEFLQVAVSDFYYYIAYFFITKTFSADKITVQDYFNSNPALLVSTSFRMTKYITTTVICVGTIILIAKFLFRTGAGKFAKSSDGCIKTAFVWFPSCFLINAVFTLLFSYIMALLSAGGISIPQSDLTISSPSKSAIITQFAYTIVVAPIVEEYIYRGLVLGCLSKHSKSASVLLSALAFGLMHGNLPQATSAFLTGLVYALIAVNSGSIIPTIIIHSLNNIIAGFPNFAKAMNIPHYTTIYSAVVIILALAGLFSLCTHYKQLNVHNENNGVIPHSKVNRLIFTNPFILIYLGILVFLIVLSIFLANR